MSQIFHRSTNTISKVSIFGAVFALERDADVTEKESNERRKISEVGVYTVKNGKIVREEFLPRSGD